MVDCYRHPKIVNSIHCSTMLWVWLIIALCVDHVSLVKMTEFDTLLKGIDHSTGIAKCLDVVSRLDYLNEEQARGIHSLIWASHYCIFNIQRLPEIEQSQFILCNGALKSKNGTVCMWYCIVSQMSLVPISRNFKASSLMAGSYLPVLQLDIQHSLIKSTDKSVQFKAWHALSWSHSSAVSRCLLVTS